MIRKMLGLAWEAAKVEIDLRRNPPPALEEHIESAPAPEPPRSVTAAVTSSKWMSTKFQMEALAAKTCPDCGVEKKVGSYRCVPCWETAVAARKAAS